MRDNNVGTVTSGLMPADGSTPMSALSKQVSALFLDDWPAPAKCVEEELDSVTMKQVRKWRLQTLLAVSPFGVPSLALASAYEKMFGRKFDLRDFDCDNLDDLINQMSDILVVEQPSSTTAILFPDYPHDTVLHDIRLGHDFSCPNFDDDAISVSTSMSNKDCNDLIYQAWMDRDEEFPPDAVLIGEPYEQLLKISMANIPGSRGLYRAYLVSAASPDTLCIRLKASEENVGRIRGLSNEIDTYFKSSKYPIDAYNVPKEFIEPNFPCLLYSKERAWERCVVVSSASGGKILVECVDFCGVYAVNPIFLYLIPRKFLEIPRQTLTISLVGLKPAGGASEWQKQVGARMRCFSIEDYWLDVLLIEPKEAKKLTFQRREVASNGSPQNRSCVSVTGSNGQSSSPTQDSSKKKRISTQRVSYDAIIVDRNDEEFDVYMDELLVMETYAEPNISRIKEIRKLKVQLKEALKTIPRPENPLKDKDLLV